MNNYFRFFVSFPVFGTRRPKNSKAEEKIFSKREREREIVGFEAIALAHLPVNPLSFLNSKTFLCTCALVASFVVSFDLCFRYAVCDMQQQKCSVKICKSPVWLNGSQLLMRLIMEFVLTLKLIDNLVFCDLPCLFQLHLLRVRLGFWKLKLGCCLGV